MGSPRNLLITLSIAGTSALLDQWQDQLPTTMPR
jgi:hypothetical protein